ncbi:Beta-1,3-galactosyltransferase 1 [Chamberlinius hualienensis]
MVEVKKLISSSRLEISPPSVVENDKYLLKKEDANINTAKSDVRVVNPHDFEYIINEEELCKKNGPHRFFEQSANEDSPDSPFRDIFMIICVSSAPKHHDRRLSIRQAWANSKALSRLKVIVVFLLGSTSNPREQMLIQQESDMFHDIIQENFVDSYYNLSIKSVMGLKWATNYCSNIFYYMKADDDVYINVELVVDFLKIYGQRRWIGGCVKQIKSPRPLDTNGMPITIAFGHPLFAAGAGYVLSSDIVPELYQTSLERPIVPVEDAFVTGYCAKAIGVTPTHYGGFNCGESITEDCQMKIKFVGHHITTERQFQIWKTLHTFKDMCPPAN